MSFPYYKGNLDSQSATLFWLPGMCSTVMFLSYNSKDHLSNVTLSVLPVTTFCRDLASLLSTIFASSK